MLHRACGLLEVTRSTMGYESRLANRDASVIHAIREHGGQYLGFRCRRIHVFLARQGHGMSADRAYRAGGRRGFRCRPGGPGSALQRTDRALAHQVARTRSGRTTWCSTDARRGTRSSA